MDQRREELEARERTNSLNEIDREELDILRKLKDVQDKQTAHAAKVQRENLVHAAAEGDLTAQQKLSEMAVDEGNQEYRDKADREVAEERKDLEKEQKKVADEEKRFHDDKIHQEQKKGK